MLCAGGIAFVAGAGAAVGSGIVKVPLAVCIRSVQAGAYPNAFAAARSIVDRAGARSLFTVSVCCPFLKCMSNELLASKVETGHTPWPDDGPSQKQTHRFTSTASLHACSRHAVADLQSGLLSMSAGLCRVLKRVLVPCRG